MIQLTSALPAKNNEKMCNDDHDNKNKVLKKKNCVILKRKYQISTECACQMATDFDQFNIDQCDFYHQDCHNLNFTKFAWNNQQSTNVERAKNTRDNQNEEDSNISCFSNEDFASKVSDDDKNDKTLNCSNDGLIKYETYLENIDPENLCDCQSCLSIFKNSPERVLACYGIEVDGEQTAAENNQYNDLEENFHRFAKNKNCDENFCDNANGNDEYKSNNTNVNGFDERKENPFLVSESANASEIDNSNPCSIPDNAINSLSNIEKDLKSKLIKNAIFDTQPKPYKPLSLVNDTPSLYLQSMPFIAKRKQEKPLEGLKIVTISLNCKVESCPLIFLDKNQLYFHMLYAHDMHPFKCWAGCVEKYFPCR